MTIWSVKIKNEKNTNYRVATLLVESYGNNPQIHVHKPTGVRLRFEILSIRRHKGFVERGCIESGHQYPIQSSSEEHIRIGPAVIKEEEEKNE